MQCWKGATFSWSHQCCFLLEGRARRFPEDPGAPAVPECRHPPVECDRGTSSGTRRCTYVFLDFSFHDDKPYLGSWKTNPCFSLNSRWARKSPLSLKTKTQSVNLLLYYRHQYILCMSPSELYGQVPPSLHPNMYFHCTYHLKCL